ncbi:MAG: ATP-binding protein [Nitrospiria bacterium]
MWKDHEGKRLHTFKSRLFIKFIIPYTFLIVTVLSLSGWFFYSFAKNALDVELSRRLVGIAHLVADSINPNFLLRLQPGDEDTSLYRLLLGKLLTVKEATKIKDIHLFNRENQVMVDLDETQRIGEENLLLEIDALELEKVWAGASISSILYRGVDGNFYKVGYAPIRNRQGQIIAAVGVEVGVDFMLIVNQIQGQILWITLICAACIVLISFVLSRSMIHPIQGLATATEQVGKEGIYPKVDLSRNDELGDLGNHFNRMIDQLKVKDDLLKKMYQEEKSRAEELEGTSQTLLKSIPSGVLGVDLKGHVTSCNRAAEEIMGISAVQLTGKEVMAGLGPFQALGKIILTTINAKREAKRDEILIDDPSFEDKRWIGVVTSLLRDTKGKHIGATAVFSDMTEIRKLQEEIQLKEQLAMLGELSAGLAHEIRNPLAAIQTLVEIFAHKSKGKEEKELAGEVIGEVTHLNQFVTDFLRFARSPSLHPEPTPVDEIVNAALGVAIPDLKKVNLTIERNIPKDLPKIHVDPYEFRRVLINVIQNAVQAMQGSGELTISSEFSNDCVILRIRDTGPGLQEDEIKKIFQPFFTTKQGGTGLGLAISHRIITGHGGSIYMKNNEIKGTSLFIEVPIHTERKVT